MIVLVIRISLGMIFLEGKCIDFFFEGSANVEEKAVAPHSSTLAWKIPWTEEPGGLRSMGLLRVRHS